MVVETVFESTGSDPQIVPALTCATLSTVTGAPHTSPIAPFTVIVIEAVGTRFSAEPVHTYRVPVPATDVTAGAGRPGCVVDASITTGDTVSLTTRLSIVAAPVFVITIWYWSGSPTPV